MRPRSSAAGVGPENDDDTDEEAVHQQHVSIYHLDCPKCIELMRIRDKLYPAGPGPKELESRLKAIGLKLVDDA